MVFFIYGGIVVLCLHALYNGDILFEIGDVLYYTSTQVADPIGTSLSTNGTVLLLLGGSYEIGNHDSCGISF